MKKVSWFLVRAVPAVILTVLGSLAAIWLLSWIAQIHVRPAIVAALTGSVTATSIAVRASYGRSGKICRKRPRPQ
jgi:chromate transport protein ChrA